jgi:hypothetical protein
MYLATINTTTGIMTDIGMSRSWCCGHGLSFLPGDVLYTWDTTVGLSTLSLVDGSDTTIGFGAFSGFPTPVINPFVPSMDTDQNGTLYGILYDDDNGNRYLVTINPSNGDMTYVSTLPDNMQNIAFSQAPAPPAQPSVVPTMTEWGMILFMVFAGIGAIYYLRRQRIAG